MQAIGAAGEEEPAATEEELIAEPAPMPNHEEGVSGCYLFIASTREETATRHAFVRR